MANICCSIELEPRTLKQGQLNHAREVAADVAQNLKAHGASTLFSEGLSSVDDTVKKTGQIIDEVEDCKENIAELGDIPCQCSSMNGPTIDKVESPVQNEDYKSREPLSAPF